MSNRPARPTWAQREINHMCDLMVKKDKREAMLMTLGKMPLPGTVRPTLRGWAAIVTQQPRSAS